MQNKRIKTGWLAFPLVLKEKKGIERKDLQIYLEKKGIQTRTIFTGNILRQPIMKGKLYTIVDVLDEGNIKVRDTLYNFDAGISDLRLCIYDSRYFQLIN